MATGDIIPETDNSVAWQTTGTPHADEIDEAKASPNTSDYIFGTYAGGDDTDVDDFNMTSLTVSSVSQIQVYAYASYVIPGTASVDLYNGSGWEGYQTLGGSASPAYSWTSFTFTGLSMTNANLADCRVRFRANVSGKGAEIYIATVYAIVTYTTTNIAKIQGVSYSNIAKIQGVAKANISKIQGITV